MTSVYVTWMERTMCQADLKKLLVCYALTYPPNWQYPKFVFGHSGEFFLFFKEPTTDRFKFTTIFLSKTLFSIADNVLKYYIFMASILDHLLSTVKGKLFLIQK